MPCFPLYLITFGAAHSRPLARVVKWQTRTFEGRMPQGVGVQVPPRAPSPLKTWRVVLSQADSPENGVAADTRSASSLLSDGCTIDGRDYFLCMKAFKFFGVVSALSLAVAVSVSAQPNDKNAPKTNDDGYEERLVYVTGSLIPKKVRVKKNTPNTAENVRIYSQHDLERTGSATTGGALQKVDPSIQVRR